MEDYRYNNKLKTLSTTALEEVIAKALSAATDGEFRVSISGLEFGGGITGTKTTFNIEVDDTFEAFKKGMFKED